MGKSFISRHKIGLIGAGILTILTYIVNGFHKAIQASFEASASVLQLQDSIVVYSFVNKLLYSNFGENIIFFVGGVLVVLCLIPTAKDLLKGE